MISFVRVCGNTEKQTERRLYSNNIRLAFITKLPRILEHVHILVIIDSINSLSPFGVKPFLESMLIV